LNWRLHLRVMYGCSCTIVRCCAGKAYIRPSSSAGTLIKRHFPNTLQTLICISCEGQKHVTFGMLKATFDKRGDFDFLVVKFSFSSSNMHGFHVVGVIVSQKLCYYKAILFLSRIFQ